jgi:uncharacterized membrane protein
MTESAVLLFLWVLFGGTHLVLSSAKVRPLLIGRLGLGPFLGLYSLVAFATLIPLCWYYGLHKHTGPQLWKIFGGAYLYLPVRDLQLALMGFAFVLLVAGLVSRPPSGMIVSGPPQAYGITRITRHPTFAAISLFGLSHCLVNGSLSDVIFFGGFAVFPWVGAWHQDTRKVVEVPGYAQFKEVTSFIPFAAILRKQQPLNLYEFRWLVVLIALVIFYLVRAYHPYLFGGVLMAL